MQRTAELFIQKGVIKEMAPSDNYLGFGIIEIDSYQESPDQEKMIVYTHSKHSFTDSQIQPTKDTIVYFFLIPLEYLFSDIKLGNNDDAPMLAVNITPIFPYLISTDGIKMNRHPCTTALTVAADSFETNPPSEVFFTSFLLLPILSINYFFKSLLHKNHRFFYGINDYGEFTIIQTKNKEEEDQVKPWVKIWLEPHWKKHAHFSRAYSPKRKGEKKVECLILKQNFIEVDKKWIWNIILNNPNKPKNPNNPNKPNNLKSMK